MIQISQHPSAVGFLIYLTRCRLRYSQRERFRCPFSPWQWGEGGRQAGWGGRPGVNRM